MSDDKAKIVDEIKVVPIAKRRVRGCIGATEFTGAACRSLLESGGGMVAMPGKMQQRTVSPYVSTVNAFEPSMRFGTRIIEGVHYIYGERHK